MAPNLHARTERQEGWGQRGSAAILTQAVVSIVSQHEPIKAGAPVVPGDVDAVMDTASVVVIVLTLVDVCKGRGTRRIRARVWLPSPTITSC